jgi:hypothetical protein
MEASEDGKTLTGRVLGDIVDGQRKKHLLEHIASIHNIPFEQVHRVCEPSNERRLRWGMVRTICLCCSERRSAWPIMANRNCKRMYAHHHISLTRRPRDVSIIPILHCSSTSSDSPKKSRSNWTPPERNSL